MVELCLRDALGQPREGGEGAECAPGFPDGGRHRRAVPGVLTK